MVRDTGRGIKYSLLPAITLDGIIAPFIVTGSVTQDVFDYWFEQILLPQMQPWPRDRSVLVLDNCSIHKSARIQQLIQAKGE